jgi:hypothetical protein
MVTCLHTMGSAATSTSPPTLTGSAGSPSPLLSMLSYATATCGGGKCYVISYSYLNNKLITKHSMITLFNIFVMCGIIDLIYLSLLTQLTYSGWCGVILLSFTILELNRYIKLLAL